MTIQSNYSGAQFPAQVKIRKYHTSRLAFNFSFLTPVSKYNLDKNSKTVNNKVKLKLLDKIRELSQEDIVAVLGYNKYQGLERIPEEKVRLRIHPEFKRSKRYDECDDDYWVFRLGKLGRVIGKRNMSIDASFDQYDHGNS